MSHEAAHVATGAAIEHHAAVAAGGLRRLRRPARRRPARLRDGRRRSSAEVRRDGPPDALPGPAEFDTATRAPGGGLRERLAGLRRAGRRSAGRTRWWTSTERSTHGPSVDAALRAAVGLRRARAHRRGGRTDCQTWPRERSRRRDPAGPACRLAVHAGRAARPSWCWRVRPRPVGPGPRAGRRTGRPPSDVFTAAEIAAAERVLRRWARVWSWCALAVSMARRLLAGLPSAGPAGSWSRGCRAGGGSGWCSRVAALSLIGRLATLPLAVAAYRHLRRLRAVEPVVGAASLLDLAKGEPSVAVVDHLARAAGAGRLRASLAARLAGRRRRRAGRRWCCSAPSSIRSSSSRCSTTSTRCPTASLRTPDPRARRRRRACAVDDVLVADASRRTTTLNAYVSGFGSTRRVVLYDNLVEDLPEDQALSVVAHELAHARHRDVLIGSALGAAGRAVRGRACWHWSWGPGAAAPAVAWPTRRWCRWCWPWPRVARWSRARCRTAISRRIETRADVDALEATEDPAAFVAMQRQLALRSLQRPDAARLVTVLVRQPPDHAAADRAGRRQLADDGVSRCCCRRRVLDGRRTCPGRRAAHVTPSAERRRRRRRDRGRSDAGDEQAVLDGGGPASRHAAMRRGPRSGR